MRHHSTSVLVLAAMLASSLFGAESNGQSELGSKLGPEAFGVGLVETMGEVVSRDLARGRASDEGQRLSRAPEHGEWFVPSRRRSAAAHSGLHYVTNRWGDTSMGIGFGELVDVDGAWFFGHASPEVWTSGLRVLGYRGGELVDQTRWFRDIDGKPARFSMQLQRVDRIEIQAEAVIGGGGWYAMDDLAFRPSSAGEGTAPTVLDFEDLAWRTGLTDGGYAGLSWEMGSGSFYGEPAVIPAPWTPRETDPVQASPPTAESSGSAGTLPTLSFSFDGPRMFDNGTSFIPPDSSGAVGLNHYVSIVNSKLSVYDKVTATRLVDTPLSSFWTATGVLGDPRIVFDPHSQRFFILASDGISRLHIAISMTADPTGAWYKNSIIVSSDADAGNPPDFPTLGVDENGFYSGALMAGGPFTMSLFAIDKAPLLSATPSLGTVTAWRGIPFEGALQPCVDYDVAPGAYVITRKGSLILKLRRIDGPLTAPTLVTLGTIPVSAHGRAFSAPALGSTVPLATSDTRLVNAVLRNGSIWTVHNIDVGGRAACRWYQVDPIALALEQEGTVDDPLLHYIFPSIAVNARGDMTMSFSGTSANQYAGSYFTGRLACDPLNQMAVPALMAPGLSGYNYLDGGGLNRWGDYSLTSVDPADDLSMWTIQEYARGDGTWGTWVGKLEFPLPCDPLSISSVQPDTFDSLVPGTSQFLSIVGSGFTASTRVAVDGVVVDAALYTRVTGELLTLDMPQLGALGSHTIEVLDGAQFDSAPVQVVAPTEPQLQLGSGDALNIITAGDGVEILVAGQPGELHYVLYSTSAVPSVHPIVSLCLGNNFSELFLGTAMSIPPEGWTSTNVPAGSVGLFQVIYSQSVELLSGRPIPTSGCQSVVIVP